jgi:NitT/TauT family transport system substrate-binding protein
MLTWAILLQATVAISVAGPATSAEYSPVHLAAAGGALVVDGSPVKMVQTRSPADAAQALNEASADLAATTFEAALRFGHRGGQPPRLLMGLTGAPPVALLVAGRGAGAVRTAADLVGRTVGIPAPGTPEHWALRAILVTAQVGPRWPSILSFGERGLASALAAGDVDAAMLDDPAISRLSGAGEGSVLIDLRDPDQARRWLGGPTVHAGIFLRADSKLGAAQLAPLLRGLVRSATRLQRASPEEVAAELPREVAGRPEDFALRLEGARRAYLSVAEVGPEQIERSLILVRALGPVPATVKLPARPSALVFAEPLRHALEGSRP